MNNISDTMPESRPGEDDVPIDARAIIRDFLKLPYAISGSLECVVVVDDWKTVDMVIPTQILGAVALGGKTKNQIFGTPILDEWRVRRKFIRDGSAIDGGLLYRIVVWEVGQLLVGSRLLQELGCDFLGVTDRRERFEVSIQRVQQLPVRTLCV